MAKRKHKILIAGIPGFCRFFQRILHNNNMTSIVVHDVNRGITALTNEKIDLLITNMVFPDLGGFVLIQKIQELNLHIPYIMLTPCEQVSDYIGLAYDYDVGYILNRTFEDNEIINIIKKLVNHEKLFGFHHYLDIDDDDIHEIDVWDSQQAQDIAAKVTEFALDANMDKDKIRSLRLVFDEMAHNAIYHAHGFRKQKKLGIPVSLPHEKKIQIKYALDHEKIGVSVIDFEGKLTLSRVLKSLKDILDNNEKMFKALKAGQDFTPFIKEDGRGFQIAIETSDEFYVNIKPNKFTQIIFLVWLEKKADKFPRNTLHIREFAPKIPIIPPLKVKETKIST